MRQTSGIVIKNDIFINSSQVIKMDKDQHKEEINVKDDNGQIKKKIITVYTINIYLSYCETPVSLNLDSESNRDVLFNKIVMEMYGGNYAHVNFAEYIKPEDPTTNETQST